MQSPRSLTRLEECREVSTGLTVEKLSHSESDNRVEVNVDDETGFYRLFGAEM